MSFGEQPFGLSIASLLGQEKKEDNYTFVPTKIKPKRGAESGYMEFNPRNHFQGNVLGYIRVSTLMQLEEGHSLEHQIDSIKKHAQYKHLNLHRIYKDGGISGKLIKNRPAINEALEDLRSGDTFVVTSLSRLCRSLEDAIAMNKQFTEKRINFIILDLQIQTASPDGEFLFNLFASLAQQERRKISERTKNVIHHMIETGTHKRKPKFGYISPDKRVPNVENEFEQEIISNLKLLKKKYPKITIEKLFNFVKEKYPPPRKSKEWYLPSFRKILIDNGIIQVKKDKETECKIVVFLKEQMEAEPEITDAELTRRVIANFPPYGRLNKWSQSKIHDLLLKYNLREKKEKRKKGQENKEERSENPSTENEERSENPPIENEESPESQAK